jgi:hypothetical protein
MKCKSLALAVLLAGFAASALAQTAVSGAIKCPKSDPSYTVEVGDHPGHMMILEKGSCTWSTPLEIAGLKSTAYAGADSVDVVGPKGLAHGYSLITMDNGDKVYVRYQGTGMMSKEGNLTGEGTWSFTGGTGKLKGLKGKGTYKDSGTPDGNLEAQLEGEYSLPGPGAAAKKR